ASGPTPRYSAASGWDPTTGHVVLAGGCCNASGGFLTDTWTFDGSAWTRHERSDAPSPRIQVQAVTDTDHHDLVLFGGFGGDGFMADTWTERAGAWQEAQSTTSPVGRAAASIAYDSDHHVTVLFGGQAQSANSCATTPDALN